MHARTVDTRPLPLPPRGLGMRLPRGLGMRLLLDMVYIQRCTLNSVHEQLAQAEVMSGHCLYQLPTGITYLLCLDCESWLWSLFRGAGEENNGSRAVCV